MPSPYKSKTMRLEVDGVIVDTVELVTLETSHMGGVESKYGQDYDYQFKPRNRHAIGMKRCRFTIRKWYKADGSNTDLFYTLFDNDTVFTLKEYVTGIAGFSGLIITGCEIYTYTPTTGAANDIIQEEISGEGTLWNKEIINWLTGWNVRRCHDINSAVGAGTDYQIKITVYYGAGVSSDDNVYCDSKCRTDFGDIRFTGSDGVTELDYWMESKVDSDNAIFWVEVKESLENNVTIHMYYDNTSAITTSNFDNTFIFGDPFDNTTLDTSRWILVDDYAGQTVYTINAGLHYLEVTGFYGYSGVYGFHSRTNIAFPDEWIIEGAYSNEGAVLKHYAATAGICSGSGFVMQKSTTATIFNFYIFDAWVFNFNYVERCNVGTSNWDSGILAGVADVWYDISCKVWKLNGKIKIEVAGTQQLDVTDANILDRLVLNVNHAYGFGMGKERFYSFKIRKYVSPEPTHSTWCDETTQ